MASKDKQILVRVPTELYDRFVECVRLESETLGFGEELSLARAHRSLMRDYITKWESIGQSETAKAAGKILARGRKNARG